MLKKIWDLEQGSSTNSHCSQQKPVELNRSEEVSQNPHLSLLEAMM